MQLMVQILLRENHLEVNFVELSLFIVLKP